MAILNGLHDRSRRRIESIFHTRGTKHDQLSDIVQQPSEVVVPPLLIPDPCSKLSHSNTVCPDLIRSTLKPSHTKDLGVETDRHSDSPKGIKADSRDGVMQP